MNLSEREKYSFPQVLEQLEAGVVFVSVLPTDVGAAVLLGPDNFVMMRYPDEEEWDYNINIKMRPEGEAEHKRFVKLTTKEFIEYDTERLRRKKKVVASMKKTMDKYQDSFERLKEND